MPDFESLMLTLAKADRTDPPGFVYAMREAFTAVYRQGFEDGQAAEHRDQGVARILAEKETKEAADRG